MIMPILGVKDIEASIAFYRDNLGFNLGVTMPGADGKTNFAIVDLGGKVMIGLSLDHQTAQRGNGVVFMAYVPDEQNIDSYYDDVQKRGTAITTPIKTEYWGDRVFELKDPDGYLLSFCKTVKQMTPEEIVAAGTAR